MGMSEATELEEVSAGGSYLLVSLEGRTLLFPTDRTLRGFSTTQPNKGLYNYEQQSVAKAEIIEPALLEKSGGVWRVIQKGSRHSMTVSAAMQARLDKIDAHLNEHNLRVEKLYGFYPILKSNSNDSTKSLAWSGAKGSGFSWNFFPFAVCQS